MRELYLAWKHGGACPYRLHNELGDDYLPLEWGELERWSPPRPPLRPPSPRRLGNVLRAFALAAEQEEQATALAGGAL